MNTERPTQAARALRLRPLHIALLIIGVVSLLAASCAPVRFNQKRRLGEAAMQFDADPLRAEMVGKIQTSREGAVGGFHGSSVGGCGCN